VFFTAAGVAGIYSDDVTDRTASHFMALSGIFGTLVLLANIIWGYNIFRTCAGWDKK
jgi:cytochrome c oxidase cbb3-type subunit 1